jgi:hypothetical protein
MWKWAILPFVLQGVAIFLDETIFHYKRGLPRWEKIGHPLDTLSLLLCILFAIFMPFSWDYVKVYTGLSIFSCLMVTKDEFIHKEHCPGAENWLHAFLFLLHPINLLVIGFIWASQSVVVPEWVSFFLDNPFALQAFLYSLATGVFVFFLYQAIFWNILWRNYPVLKQ